MANKILLVSALVLFSLLMFVSGANFAYHKPVTGIVDLVLAAFWLCILLLERSFLKDKIELLKATVKQADNVFIEMAKAKEIKVIRKPAAKAPVKVKVEGATKKVSPKIKVAPAKKVSK